MIGVWVIQPLQWPIPVRWEIRYRVLTSKNQLPEICRTAHASRIAARHAHNRNWFTCAADAPILPAVFSRKRQGIAPFALCAS
jgi:hypothetical protein